MLTDRILQLWEVIMAATVEIQRSCYRVIHQECALACMWLVDVAPCQVTLSCFAWALCVGNPVTLMDSPVQMNERAAFFPIWAKVSLNVALVVSTSLCSSKLWLLIVESPQLTSVNWNCCTTDKQTGNLGRKQRTSGLMRFSVTFVNVSFWHELVKWGTTL